MTLAELRTSVRLKLDDLSYEQAVVDESINWYVLDVLTRIQVRFMETEDEVFVAADDTTGDFPDDLLTLLSLTATDPQVGDVLKNYVAYADFKKNYANYQTATAQAVLGLQWTDFANAMRFAAPAKVDTTIACDYLRSPVVMVDDADICDIPDRYMKMVVIGALAEVMERNEDYAEAEQERGKLEPLELTFKLKEGRGMLKVGPNVVRTNRGIRNSSYRVDRDF